MMNQLRLIRLELILFFCSILCTGCSRTSYSPSTQTSIPPYKGKVLLLRNEVPGAEEVGIIRVDTNWFWLSKGSHVTRWKKEAASHGANAVRWYGEGCSDFQSYSFAKAYRIQDPADPRIKECLAQPYDYYHEAWLPYYLASRRIRNGQQQYK